MPVFIEEASIEYLTPCPWYGIDVVFGSMEPRPINISDWVTIVSTVVSKVVQCKV